MKGYRITALTPKGTAAVKNLYVKDKRVVIEEISNNPYSLSFLFKHKIMQHVITLDSVLLVAMRMLPGCTNELDYKIEMIE